MILITLIWFFLPMISGATFGSNDLLWLMSSYLAGAYLKKLPPVHLTKKASWVSLVIVLPLYTGGMIACRLLAKNGGSWSVFSTISNLVWSKNSVVVLYIAINLFAVTLFSKPFHSKIVNFFSASTLGVYLIHDNSFFRDFLWHNIFKVENQAESNFLLLNLFWVSLAILFGCLLIDIIRRFALELPLFKLLGKPINKIETTLASWISKIS